MTFSGMARYEDRTTEESSNRGSSNVWREVDFDSDVDHKEMTRSYASDDYLARWLPHINPRHNKPPQLWKRKEKRNENRREKETAVRIYKTPCHHHEGRILRENKIQRDPGRKTYFEAIKCSPIKLRQSTRSFKSAKLDDNFALKTAHNMSCISGNMGQATPLGPPMESTGYLRQNNSTTLKTVEKAFETNLAKSRSSLGFVETQNDKMGQLGSLCFRRSLPENICSENMNTAYHLVGGKLRKHYSGTGSVLLTGHHRNKEMLVRCESIMIYPKVLLNQNEHSNKVATNSKQQSERYNVTEYQHQHQAESGKFEVFPYHHRQQHQRSQQQFDMYKNVSNFQQHSSKMAGKPVKPKQAWNHDTRKLPQEVTSEKTETDHTQLSWFSCQKHASQQENEPNTQSEQKLRGTAIVESSNIRDRPKSTKKSASTKIIIPFGETKLMNKTAERHSEAAGTFKKQKGVEKVKKAAGKSNENRGERGTPLTIKARYLTESSNSKLNKKSPGRSFNIHVGQDEVSRKEAINTQYVTVNLPNSLVRKFRIPTGVDNNELSHAGRENYPPKTKREPYFFAYSQRGRSECAKRYDGVDMTDHNGKENMAFNNDGKSFLKSKLVENKHMQGKVHVEEEKKKKVQFLVHNSRYCT